MNRHRARLAPTSERRAFTLVELIIVVSIITILATLAIPHLLEAQTRAKVSRVKADHRTIVLALECYRLDENNYPPSLNSTQLQEMRPLTTPVAYISSIPLDPFVDKLTYIEKFREGPYDFIRYEQTFDPYPVLQTGGDVPYKASAHYFLLSVGPNRSQETYFILHEIPHFLFPNYSYDPTNGTISNGDIFTLGASSIGS